MTAKFDACHAITAKWEGGWSDHERDPGGKTNWGITQATLSAHLGRPATAAEIRALTKERARAIYVAMYWDVVSGDQLPPGVDLCVYDFGVNSGPERAVKSLQTALGVRPDGWVGEATLEALATADTRALIETLCKRRLAFMRACKGRDGKPLWPTFGKGWQRRVDDIRKRALAMAGKIAPAAPLSLLSVPDDGTAKALPEPPVESGVSTEQKIGGGAGLFALVATPVASFWRDNSDVLTSPVFLVVVVALAAVIVALVLRKPKLVETLS